MNQLFQSIFDPIHMSQACQEQILAAVSSPQKQEDSAMKPAKKIVKSLLLAAALTATLSAAALASYVSTSDSLLQLSSLSEPSAFSPMEENHSDVDVSFVLDKQACEEYNLNVLQDTKQNETVLTIIDQS